MADRRERLKVCLMLAAMNPRTFSRMLMNKCGKPCGLSAASKVSGDELFFRFALFAEEATQWSTWCKL